MQPSISQDLVPSFEKLLEEILMSAQSHNAQQNILNNYLKSNPKLFSVRFRTLYLKDDFGILLNELRRTCSITEDNIDLLKFIVDNIDSSDLNSSYNKHKNLIRRQVNPKHSSINSAVMILLSDNLGPTSWFNFCHKIGIPDASVDDFENLAHNEKMEKTFAWIEDKIPLDQQMQAILQALNKVDRRDLAEMVMKVVLNK